MGIHPVRSLIFIDETGHLFDHAPAVGKEEGGTVPIDLLPECLRQSRPPFFFFGSRLHLFRVFYPDLIADFQQALSRVTEPLKV